MSDLYSTWIRIYGVTPGNRICYECENCKATWIKEYQEQHLPERCPRCNAKMEECIKDKEDNNE